MVDAGARVLVAGVREMLVSAAEVTFSCALPVVAPKVALMVTGPVPTAVTIPFAPEVLIVATVVSLDVHVTLLVMV